MDWHATCDFLAPCFPESVRAEMMLLEPGELQEIRIRADRPAVFITGTRRAALQWKPGMQQLEALVEALSGHSLYCREEEAARGYLTLCGGHRLGFCGRVVQHGSKAHLAQLSSVCLRIAAQWQGCADMLMPLLQGADGFGSLLVIGPPGSGKTTLLRDLARQASTTRQAWQTAVIDERGEFAACLNGVPQMDVGSADVLEGLAKPDAIRWLIRSAAPEIIITDELADAEDAAALADARCCGCAVCASCHGTSLTDAAARPAIAGLMAKRLFDRYAVLSPAGGGTVIALHDRTGAPLPLPS